jgi:hypothetical protein
METIKQHPEEGIMNCDYCGIEVQYSEATMTDMGDMVCTPCLIGKPAEIVTLDFIPTKKLIMSNELASKIKDAKNILKEIGDSCNTTEETAEWLYNLCKLLDEVC